MELLEAIWHILVGWKAVDFRWETMAVSREIDRARLRIDLAEEFDIGGEGG